VLGDMHTTLVSEVIRRRPNGSDSRRNCVTTIVTTPRGMTLVTIDHGLDGSTTIRLTGAERIALIEALGGTR
jgi:hypothetical protein